MCFLLGRKCRFLAAVLCLFSLGSCGFSSSAFVSRDEFISFVSRNDYCADDWFYCGTDDQCHHFLTRIGGNSVPRRVPKEQIKLAETWPVGQPLRKIYPLRGFAFGDERKIWHYSPR